MGLRAKGTVAQDARPARAGRGLKLEQFGGVFDQRLGRPAREGRARIETSILCVKGVDAIDARPARAGRGLKLNDALAPVPDLPDARPARAGRGLKPEQFGGVFDQRLTPGPRGPGED